jgi:hypothetical protein
MRWREVIMNEETVSNLKAEDAKLLELGFTLGQNHTFGVLAGRCSAAHAQGIRRLREEKLYKGCGEKWDDFCPKYLKMSRGEADRIVRLLDEFGPAYFELSQLARISAATFRAIAPAVSDGVLHHNGEAIALTPENSQKVAAAVAEIRSALPKKSTEPDEPAPAILRRIQDSARRCAESLAELDKISRDEHLGTMRIQLRNELTRLRDQMLHVAA